MKSIIIILSGVVLLSSCSSLENPRDWNKDHPRYEKSSLNYTKKEVIVKSDSKIKKEEEASVPEKMKTMTGDKISFGAGLEVGKFSGLPALAVTGYSIQNDTSFYLGFKVAKTKGSYSESCSNLNNCHTSNNELLGYGKDGYLNKNMGPYKTAMAVNFGGQVLKIDESRLYLGASVVATESCDEVWESSIGYYQQCVNHKKETRVVPEIKLLHNFSSKYNMPASITVTTDKEVMVGIVLFSW